MIGILISPASLNARRPAQRAVVPALGLLCVLLTAGAAAAQTQARSAATSIELSNALEATARLVTPAVVEIFATSYTPGEGVLPHRRSRHDAARVRIGRHRRSRRLHRHQRARRPRRAAAARGAADARRRPLDPRDTQPHGERAGSSGSTSKPIWR